MKKRNIFIIAYIIVMIVLGLPALSQMKLSRPTAPLPRVPEVMLMIGCGMCMLLLTVLLIWRIAKYILVKLGKRPDDYFVYRISAPKTLEHMIWTRSGIYRKNEDRAERERGEREQMEIEW